MYKRGETLSAATARAVAKKHHRGLHQQSLEVQHNDWNKWCYWAFATEMNEAPCQQSKCFELFRYKDAEYNAGAKQAYCGDAQGCSGSIKPTSSCSSSGRTGSCSEEKRVSWQDGHLYTWREFVEFHGETNGRYWWHRAAPIDEAILHEALQTFKISELQIRAFAEGALKQEVDDAVASPDSKQALIGMILAKWEVRKEAQEFAPAKIPGHQKQNEAQLADKQHQNICPAQKEENAIKAGSKVVVKNTCRSKNGKELKPGAHANVLRVDKGGDVQIQIDSDQPLWVRKRDVHNLELEATSSVLPRNKYPRQAVPYQPGLLVRSPSVPEGTPLESQDSQSTRPKPAEVCSLIRVSVNGMTGGTIDLEMQQHDTIKDLKRRVQEHASIPVLFQKCIIGTSVTNDFDALGTYQQTVDSELLVTLLKSVDGEIKLENFSAEDQLCALKYLLDSSVLPQMVSQVKAFQRSDIEEVRKFAMDVAAIARKARREGMMIKCPKKKPVCNALSRRA
jgi:hypothetical protein